MTTEVAVIGSGPGGYVAAIRAAQLGFKTTIIEKYPTLGGTCLNVGCIPSKALLDSSEHVHNARHRFSAHGIKCGNVAVDFGVMMDRKSDVVRQNVEGIKFLMKKNKIQVVHGHATFLDAHTLAIHNEKGESHQIEARHIIIATGSKPAAPPGIQIDKKRVITSTEALSLREIPKSMVVIGGGVIGMEMGSVYARLGTKITVIEYADRLIPGMDESMSRELQKVLIPLGMEFHLAHQVTSVTTKGRKTHVEFNRLSDGSSSVVEADNTLVCTGRRPYTDGLNLEKAGIAVDQRGRIPVNDQLQTSQSHIYAIGDVVRGTMLAHKAEEEGVFVAEVLAGQKPHIHYHLIPNVVYTWPEVASVGYTDQELKGRDVPFKTGQFAFKASGRARASMDTDGLVRVYAHKETDEILGVHMIGPRVADMIAEAVVAMEFRASAEDIARMSHAHPTYTEVFKEACLAATANRALHA
jgi:dihydrolipoamide dehydrogenase